MTFVTNGIPYQTIFYQHVTIELFEQLLHEKLEEFNTEQPLSDINISEEEEKPSGK